MLDERIVKYITQNRILGKADMKNINECLSSDTAYSQCFSSDELIYSPKNTQRLVGIIMSGTAIASPASTADGTMLRLLSCGDVFGVANLYAENECFPSIITAKTAVEVLFIDGGALRAILECDTGAMNAYLAFLCERIIYLNKKISTLTAGSAEKKLAFFLCENERDGEFSSQLSMSALSEMLNIGRASLYRGLDALAAEGLIVRDGKKIIIPDKNALLNFI